MIKNQNTRLRRVPISLHQVLDEFHNKYVKDNQGKIPSKVPKTFTDEIFANTFGKGLLMNEAKGNIQVNSKKLKKNLWEIDWEIKL